MKQRSTILYLAPMDSIHSRRWIRFFADSGFQVHVLYFDDVAPEDLSSFSDITFHHIPLRADRPGILNYLRFGWHVLRKVPAIRSTIRMIDPDLIHVHFIDFRAYLASQLDYPLMLTAWGSDVLILPKRNMVFRHLLTTSLDRAQVITCDADHMKDAIVRFGVPKDKVKVIYFGTDLTTFHPGKRDPAIRREAGFPDRAKLVISLRSLQPVYDISTLIRAVPLVLAQAQETRFIVVGGGPEMDKLVQLSRDLGVEGAVRFTGRMAQEDLQRYTASADIYVSTSLSDGGLAASTAEAMACEVPVVITDFGNNAEWVEHGAAGLLFPLSDHQALAAGILRILANPDDARRMGKRGREIIDERNNWHREMAKIESMYEELAHMRSRTAETA
jgi:glycosyltransferase involved in cell wall biosynthesis